MREPMFEFRKFIATIAIIALLAPSLGACAFLQKQTPPSVSAGIATALGDVQILSQGLQGALGALKQVQGIPQDVVTSAGNIVGQINTVAAQMQSATTSAQAQKLVQQISLLVNTLVQGVTPFVAGTPAGPIFAAASVLLPVIEVAVGIAMNNGAAPADRYRPTAAAVANARFVLLGHAPH